jgi:hypothetical protein
MLDCFLVEWQAWHLEFRHSIHHPTHPTPHTARPPPEDPTHCSMPYVAVCEPPGLGEARLGEAVRPPGIGTCGVRNTRCAFRSTRRGMRDAGYARIPPAEGRIPPAAHHCFQRTENFRFGSGYGPGGPLQHGWRAVTWLVTWLASGHVPRRRGGGFPGPRGAAAAARRQAPPPWSIIVPLLQAVTPLLSILLREGNNLRPAPRGTSVAAAAPIPT